MMISESKVEDCTVCFQLNITYSLDIFHSNNNFFLTNKSYIITYDNKIV